MIQKLLTAFRRSGWVINTQPYRLNIFGVRSTSVQSNSFDDAIHVFYKDEKGKWIIRSWQCTTDPGTYWLKSPMHSQGTAILKQGQYHSYGIGRHRGKYYALCQTKGPVTVIRDYNRDSTLDFNNGRTMTGSFGINIHRASAYGTSKDVERHSAGCQVFANAGDFNEFMGLCERHRQMYGNQFTYSLLDIRAVRRANQRKTLGWWSLALGVAALGTIAYISHDKPNEK